MVKPAQKQRILVISDAHLGAAHSRFKQFEQQLLAAAKRYDHVVFNGDLFELFYTDAASKKVTNGTENRDRVRDAIRQSKQWLQTFLEENPNLQVHFVLGNHENIRKFRFQLDKLADKYANFHWDPEGIVIGNALFTHGDLQMGSYTAAERGEWRLRTAAVPEKWNRLFSSLYYLGRPVAELRSAPQQAVERMHQYWEDKQLFKEFRALQRGERLPIDMDDIAHIFFGHTHRGFETIEKDGIAYHNTTGFVNKTMQSIDDAGMLEATLDHGKITNVRRYSASRSIS